MYLKSWISCAIALAGMLSSAQAADRPDPQIHVVEEIVAKVNGQIITRGELDKQNERIRAELQKQGLVGPALDEAVKKASADALSEQISQILLVAKGNELNINVDAEVNRKVAQIQKESGVADPEKFHDWVREQTGGDTFEDLKLQFKNSLLTQRVISEEVYRNVIIPKAELQKYYDEHKTEFIREDAVALREILISTGDKSPAKLAAAEKKAKDLADRARKGEKFADLARQNSDAETAKEEGILPGSFKKGQLAKPVEDAVFKLNKNGVTDPILLADGYRIYKVEEHSTAGQASFEEVQNEINGRLSEPKVAPKLHAFLTELRQNAFLQIKPGYVDSGAAPGKDTSWKDPAELKPQTTTKEAVANQRHFKKFMHVVPYGRTGIKDTGSAAPPEMAPIPGTPVRNADSSPTK